MLLILDTMLKRKNWQTSGTAEVWQHFPGNITESLVTISKDHFALEAWERQTNGGIKVIADNYYDDLFYIEDIDGYSIGVGDGYAVRR